MQKSNFIIFLDIDGVLNSTLSFRNDIKGMVNLSFRCISELNKLTNALSAQIVLTSSCRFIAGIQEYLVSCGVTGDIIGVIPYLIRTDEYSYSGMEVLSRGETISEYIKENNYLGDYIIIDDIDDNILPIHRHKFYHTDSDLGLTEYDVEVILNNKK